MGATDSKKPVDVDLQGLLRTHDRALSAALKRLSIRCSPHDVHRARVAVRRLRTIILELSPPIAPPVAAQLSEGLRIVAHELGLVRDVDIYYQILVPLLCRKNRPVSAAAARTLAQLRLQRSEARRQMRAALKADALQDRLRTAHRLINRRRLFALSTPPADALLTRALRRRWKKVTRGLRAHSDRPDKRHALRIQVKKCRYLLDARDAQSNKGESAKARAKLTDLQNCLGELNDIANTRHWLKKQRLGNSNAKPLQAQLRAMERRTELKLERLGRRFRRVAIA